MSLEEMFVCALTMSDMSLSDIADCIVLPYMIMLRCLIVYFPCMSLEDMVDCVLTIYE